MGEEMKKYTKPAIRIVIDGQYKREDGLICLAPGFKLVPKPLEPLGSIFDLIKYAYCPVNKSKGSENEIN
jgi:hypothetical protein